jgi:2-phosphosulfolactate phosphatase
MENPRMDIVIESLLDGARRATGTVAIIDVFRAFTTAAVAFTNGAARIIMVGDAEEALALRARGVGGICMGEVHGIAPPGFDFGNSPADLLGVDLHGVTILQRTSAGTQGIVAAVGAHRLYAAALVTATATAKAIRAGVAAGGGPARATLVAMGEKGMVRTDEDELCAVHLRHLLEGRPGDPDAIRRVILAAGAGEAGDTLRPYLPSPDIDIALDIDRFDFAIRVTIEDGRPVARREAVDGT